MERSISIFLLLFGKCWSESDLNGVQRSQWDIVHSLHKSQQRLIASSYQPDLNNALSLTLKSPTNRTNENSQFRLSARDLQSRGGVSEARGRLPFMLPVMYNLGVITTLLVVLTVLMFKGLALGVIILILNLQGKGAKHSEAPPTRPIHVHVHGSSQWLSPNQHAYYPDPWDRIKEEIENSTGMDEESTGLALPYMFHPRSFRR